MLQNKFIQPLFLLILLAGLTNGLRADNAVNRLSEFYRQGDFSGLIYYFETESDYFMDSNEAAILYTQSLESLGMWVALEKFIARFNPKTPLLKFQKSIVQQIKKEIKIKRRYAEGTTSNTFLQTLKRAENQLKSDQVEDAMILFKEAAMAQPHSPRPYLGLARAAKYKRRLALTTIEYSTMKKLEEESLIDAYKKDPAPETLIKLAGFNEEFSMEERERVYRAMELWQEIIKRFPQHPLAIKAWQKLHHYKITWKLLKEPGTEFNHDRI